VSDKISEDDIIEELDPSIIDDKGTIYDRIIVDFWATKMHGATIGVRREDQRRAQSRQYTKGMEVRGEVEFQGKDKGKEWTIAFNEDTWDVDDESKLRSRFKDKKEAKMNRRIIIKTFTKLDDKKGGRWTGTLESSLIDSMSLSIGTRKPLPVFKVVLPGDKFVYNIYRNHTLAGQRYMFYIIDEKTKEFRYFEIESEMFAIGEDFRVEDCATGKQVAYVDGKVIDIGGKWEIKFKDKNLAGNPTFRQILILFACLSKFLDDVNDSVKDLYKAITKKKYKFRPDAFELSLYKNPRMRR